MYGYLANLGAARGAAPAVASRFYEKGATTVSDELTDRDPVVLQRDTSLLGLYPVKLPEPARCKGGVLDLQVTKYFASPDGLREWRFGGGLPTLQSRLTLDVPGHYELIFGWRAEMPADLWFPLSIAVLTDSG